jgi:hypothetical protein
MVEMISAKMHVAVDFESALTRMGFPPRAVTSTLTRLHRDQPELDVEPLLRAALNLLTPHPS